MSTQCGQCGTPLSPGTLGGLCPACLLKQAAAPDTGVGGTIESFTPPPLEQIAQLFPQLEILELIGKGGMGAIYKARQRALDRLVALKLLPARPEAGPAFAERFNREARALARLSHPNIVGVHEFGQAGAFHYFLMEYVDGVNLRQLQRTGRLGPREALQIVPQICDALQYAHDEGVVHRDIKPENVLVDRKGRVKIADFGLAKILGQPPQDWRLTVEGQVMGTPHYMAPEQIERPLEVDHRADIYALGVVFYELLTGELPLGKFPPPSRKVQVDVRLDEVVLHALEKEPERRYQQASEVKTDMATIASSPAPADPLSSGESQPYRARARRRALVAGGAAFVLLLLASVVVSLIVPETYVSTARLEVKAIQLYPNGRFDPFALQTEAERIRSQAVLESALQRLNLNQTWGWRYGAGQPLTDAAMLRFLRNQVDVRQTPNSAMLEIRCYSEQPVEAAQIANAIADSYTSAKPPGAVSVIDRAEPSQRPVRPNVPLNIVFGAFAGLVIGAIVAAIVYLATRNSVGQPPERRTAHWYSNPKLLLTEAAVLAVLAAAVVFFGLARKAQPLRLPLAPSPENEIPMSSSANPTEVENRTLPPPPPIPAATAQIAQPTAQELAQSPALRFLTRQSELTADDFVTNAWHADGTLVTDPSERRLLQQLGVSRLDITALPGGKEAAIYDVWVSHPAFDQRTECQIRMQDEIGNPIPAFHGSVSSSLRQPSDSPDHNGWFFASLAIPPDKASLRQVKLVLDYTLGPWKYEQTVNMRSNFEEHISIQAGEITSPGQTLAGRAFIGLVRDPRKRPDLQYDFELETKDGRSVQAVSASSSGSDTMRTQKFEFEVPIQEVRAFHLRTRPIKTVEFENVSLAPGEKTDVQALRELNP